MHVTRPVTTGNTLTLSRCTHNAIDKAVVDVTDRWTDKTGWCEALR